MIIRSQDKHNIEIFDRACVDVGCFTVYVNGLSFGEYSTEEKAIKVLDMIQSAYNAIETMKIDKQAWKDNHYFQMPQDSEV